MWNLKRDKGKDGEGDRERTRWRDADSNWTLCSQRRKGMPRLSPKEKHLCCFLATKWKKKVWRLEVFIPFPPISPLMFWLHPCHLREENIANCSRVLQIWGGAHWEAFPELALKWTRHCIATDAQLMRRVFTLARSRVTFHKVKNMSFKLSQASSISHPKSRRLKLNLVNITWHT